MADKCSTWDCEDCHVKWVNLDPDAAPIHCPFCDSNKPPRPGGLKPIRPRPPEE